MTIGNVQPSSRMQEGAGSAGAGGNARKPCLSLALTNERTTHAQHSRPPYAATHRTHPLHIHSLSHTRPGLPLWQFYKQTSALSPRAHHTTNISQITSVLFSDSPSSCSYTYGGSDAPATTAQRRAFLDLSSSFPFLELVHQPAIQQLYSFQRRLSVARTHAHSRGDWRAVL